MGGLFSKKKFAPKSCQLYLQKTFIIYFWLGSKYGSSEYCQRSSHLKDISPVFSKTFCVFILTVHNLFCRKNQKNVLQKEIKDWRSATYLLTVETCSWFLLIESLKITCARSYAWFLSFYQTERVWVVFCNITYPNSVK